MSALHWLILIPYYYFGAHVLATSLSVLSRILRLPVTLEQLAGVSVWGSVGTLVTLFVFGFATIDDFTVLPVFGLVLLSILLSGIESLLMRALPLASERDTGYRPTTDPQVL